MDQDFFTNLPQEMMIDIVSRIPIQCVMSCKCVCKLWRDLIKTREFVESHFSRSVPCLALFQDKPYKIIELVDSQNCGQNHCNMVLNYSFPHQTILHGSANGLLLLSNNALDMFICNPITREYMKLPPSEEDSLIDHSNAFGFGVSKLTGEYKVVRLFYETYSQFNNRDSPRMCGVYTLQTGSWRSVATADEQLRYAQWMSVSISLNGNLHWLVGVLPETTFRRILCFDLETECFSTFSLPRLNYGIICALGDCLCLCDYDTGDTGDCFVIWSMNKYGDDKSWRKEFFMEMHGLWYLGNVMPIKVFKDGDILFVHELIGSKLYCYSSKTKTIRVIIDVADPSFVMAEASIFTPSFVPLKTFTIENNVISF